jgi:hypothetical protein
MNGALLSTFSICDCTLLAGSSSSVFPILGRTILSGRLSLAIRTSTTKL